MQTAVSVPRAHALWQRLFTVSQDFRTPGYIGRIPYLLVLRWFTAFGIALRAFLHRDDANVHLSLSLACAASELALAIVLTKWPLRYGSRSAPTVALVLVVADIAIISLAYFATHQLESDTFLFYLLPLLTLAEHLRGRLVAALFAVFAIVFGVTLVELTTGAAVQAAIGPPFVRVFLGRGFFLGGIVVTTWYLFRVERVQRDRIQRQQQRDEQQQERDLRQLESLRVINRETLRTLEFDRVLDEVLRQVVEELRMESATITLKDDYRDVVETVRGRNVPPGLIRLSRYPVDAVDVQTHVIKTGKVFRVDGYPEPGDKHLFNKEIFDRFEHHKLARVWVPIVDGAAIVGTIEAGCNLERASSVPTTGRCEALQQLAREKGQLLAALRPQSLLHLIAEKAVALIGADAASIHVFQAPDAIAPDRLATLTAAEVAKHFRNKEPLLTAGGGSADPKFIRQYPPRENGIGWQAILSSLREEPTQYRVINDEYELKAVSPAVYRAGVRAILAVALRVAPDTVGVLYVHRTVASRFSPSDIEIERVFAGQIEVAIQSHLLLRHTADAIQDSRSLSEWLKLLEPTAILRDQHEVLEEVAQKLLLVADADNVVLYPYMKDEQTFAKPILKGKFLYKTTMTWDVGPDHFVYALLADEKAKRPLFYRDIVRERPALAVPSPGRSRDRFIKREQIVSCAILELRTRPDNELLGLLFANYRTPRRFTPEERSTMRVLADSAAGVVRTASFYEWINRHERNLVALYQIDSTIVESAHQKRPEQILSAILSQAMKLCQAPRGAIFRKGSRGELQLVAGEASSDVTYRLGEGYVGRSAEEGAKCNLSILGAHDRPALSPTSASAVAIPLSDPNGVLGVMVIEDDQERAFSADDLEVLTVLGVQAVIAFHTIDFHKQLEIENRRAKALSVIATRIHNPGFDINRTLYLIMTGVTSGEALGFSRVMLFRPNERGDALGGQIGIGEPTHERAHASWKKLGPGPRSIEQALDTAVEHHQTLTSEQMPDLFFTAVQSMELPLTAAGGALAESFNDNVCTTRQGDQGDPFRDVMKRATNADYREISFACVPLVGTKGRIGVLVADNRFKPNEKEPISDEMVARLTAYAELASLSIQNAYLSEQAQTQTYEDLAHQLKQPITLANEYCDSVYRAADDTLRKDPHLLRLKAAIGRAQRVSMGFQHYARLARDGTLSFELINVAHAELIAMVKDSVQDFEALINPSRGITFAVQDSSFALASNVPIRANLEFFRECFENLLDNAVKYSYRETTITIDAQVTPNPLGLRVIVENTGMRIRPEEVSLICRRGYRGDETKAVTGTGAGIGLWVADGIMRAHDGCVEGVATDSHNRTKIFLWLPACGLAEAV